MPRTARPDHVEALESQIELLSQARADAELLETIYLELGPYASEGAALTAETRRRLADRFGFDDSE